MTQPGKIESTEKIGTDAILRQKSNEVAARIAQQYLGRSSAKQELLFEALHSPDNRYQPICTYLTPEECQASQGHLCDSIHFEPIYFPHTDPSRGHCSYLNTCHRMSKCRYLHFRPMRREDAPAFRWTSIYGDDPLPSRKEPTFQHGSQSNLYGFAQPALEGDERLYLEAPMRHVTRSLKAHGHGLWTRIPEAQQEQPSSAELVPAQWINADLDSFDYSILGKFDVIVADPPWDIHMSLPYGTMSDDDMRSMPFPLLQDEGYLFLWVTGRAMELGRELLAVWGYTRIDEIVWIKVGQTQRLIRTGRTGHWLNHSKEHCLVGVKMNLGMNAPQYASPLSALSITYPASHAPGIPRATLLPSWTNAGLDADVIVAEVRDTSRKPDELYNMIERLCPHGRKVELFGRKHNARPGWITVGNQLKGDHIVDEELRENVTKWRNSKAHAR